MQPLDRKEPPRTLILWAMLVIGLGVFALMTALVAHLMFGGL